MTGDRTASFPWKGGRPPHLPCGPGEVALDALLPGDPERVGLALEMLEDARDHGRRREFRAATGTLLGQRVTFCSTGIGGPSTEIAVVELANLGLRRAIRTGGMGALAEDLPLGGFLIVEAATGDTGTARAYGGGGGFQFATPRVVQALAAAATQLGVPHKVGRVCTTDSYYLAQGRATRAGGDPAEPGFVQRMRAAGIDGVEMETEALFAVGARLGIETGAILGVHGHRVTDRWLEDYEGTQRDLLRIAAGALRRLG